MLLVLGVLQELASAASYRVKYKRGEKVKRERGVTKAPNGREEILSSGLSRVKSLVHLEHLLTYRHQLYFSCLTGNRSFFQSVGRCHSWKEEFLRMLDDCWRGNLFEIRY